MAKPKKTTTAKLFFADASADRFDYNLSLPAKLDRIIEKLKFDNRFKKGELVAVKMHLGNPGTHRTIPPVLVRKVVDALKEIGARPFVADSVRIHGYKYLQTALENGYNELTLGCPVIMADGIYGNDSVEVKAGKHLKTALIPSAFYDATAMVVLTHATGHAAYGFAGAMKNIAMGLIGHHCRGGSWESGGRGQMHIIGSTKFNVNMKKCTGCFLCYEICPLDAIEKAGKKIKINWDNCWRCLRCTRVCPTGALMQPEITDDFYEAIAEGAKAAMTTFQPHKVQHISFLLDLQPECDCMPMSGVPLVSDIGILAGEDMIAIDWATLDMIADSKPNPGSMAEHLENTRENDVFAQVNNRNTRKYLEFADKLGVGTTRYKIENVS